MRPRITLLTLLLFTAALAATAQPGSPYVEFADRPIKALSHDEVTKLRDGHGMGLALAAELNSYPGPKHVLELADALELTADQRRETRGLFDDMHGRAVELGAAVVREEAGLDALFASGDIEEKTLRRAVGTIAELRGQVRLAHLAAHVKMKRLLTDEQVAQYDELRGYHHGEKIDCPHAAGASGGRAGS